jgi:tetratricopeptide (TPR) repeat protein
LSSVIFRISAGFLVGVLTLLAIVFSLSDYYMAEQQRLAAAGDLQGAMEASRKAVRLDPFDTDALEAQSFLLQQQQKYDDSAQALRVAIERDPNNYLPHLMLANLQLATEDYDAAEESYRDVLRLNPNAAIASNSLAQALMKQGKLEEAANAYEKLERDKTIDFQGLYNLGRIQVRTGEPLEGLQNLKHARHIAAADLDNMHGPVKKQRQQLLVSMDLDIADALVVQGRYGQAREILTQSPSEQAPGLLSLLNSDPAAYREQVINSDIY